MAKKTDVPGMRPPTFPSTTPEQLQALSDARDNGLPERMVASFTAAQHPPPPPPPPTVQPANYQSILAERALAAQEATFHVGGHDPSNPFNAGKVSGNYPSSEAFPDQSEMAESIKHGSQTLATDYQPPPVAHKTSIFSRSKKG